MKHNLWPVSLKDTLQLVAVADITHDGYDLGWGYNLGQFVCSSKIEFSSRSSSMALLTPSLDTCRLISEPMDPPAPVISTSLPSNPLTTSGCGFSSEGLAP